MLHGKTGMLLILGLVLAGCALQKTQPIPEPEDPGPVYVTDLLLGREPHPEKVRAATTAWKKAAIVRDTAWMEGLEERYSFPLTRRALSLALKEEREDRVSWGGYEEGLLLERTRIEIGWPDLRGVEAWKKAMMDGDFDDANKIALRWRGDTPAEAWMRNRARALALFHSGLYLQASDLLKDPDRFPLPLARRDRLFQIESLRRAGRLNDARGEWLRLADLALKARDDSLSAPLLDTAITLENLSQTPLDRGHIVALAERAETLGDIATAFRSYEEIWADPRLPRIPEVMATNNSIFLKAGLGRLRYISGMDAYGNHIPQLERWLEAVRDEPPSSARAACECELKRLEGAIYLKQHQLARALASLTEAADLCVQTGDAALVARGKGDLAVVLANCGEIKKALDSCEAAGLAAEASGDEELIYETRRNRLVLLQGMSGEAPEALKKQVERSGKALGLLEPLDV